MAKSRKALGLPKGRVTAYAFFIKDKARLRPKTVSFVAFSKQCAQQWKNMSDQKRNKYYLMASKDKKAYKQQLAAYRAKMRGKRRKGKVYIRRRKPRGPNAPRMPKNAYMIFAQKKFNTVKRQHPRTDVGGIAIILGKLWRNLSEAAKAPYYKAAKNDRARYRRQLTAAK